MTEAGLGCYVYCVIEAGEGPPLEDLRGVDPGFGVESLTHGRLTAVVSPVSLDEFGSEALKRNLEDMSWLERTARAHQSVLDRALASDAVVPMRLCTIFSDEAKVRDMLGREQDVLSAALERLRNHAEWSVKVLADPGTADAAARARSEALASADAAGGAGRAYLARKKLERNLRDEAHAMLGGASDEIHARLREQAAAATLLPAQNRELSGRSGEMILNGAYLVQRDRAAAFAAVVEELRERHGELGLELELSGPWPPYNFAAEAQLA
jgi:hypothetical protein